MEKLVPIIGILQDIYYDKIHIAQRYFVSPGAYGSSDEAESYCNSQGSNLATITDSFEQATAASLCMENNPDPDQTDFALNPFFGCWIGLFHDDSSTEWKWRDGSSLNYGFNLDGTPAENADPWWTGEPNNDDEDCLHIASFLDYKWNDTPCQYVGHLSGYYNLAICNYVDDGCITTKDYSVQFIIDESGSVSPDNYELTIDFIQNLILNDISPQAKISVIEFASFVQGIYRFNEIQFPRDHMIQVIEDADYDGGGTRTSTAISAGIDEFRRAITDGDINADDDKLLFLLTDGYPSWGYDPCHLKPALNELGVTVIIIAIDNFSGAVIACLATNPEDDIIAVAEFSQEAFNAVEDKIAETTCPEPDDTLIIPPEPKNCREAQRYCKETYGTNLATIRTDDDRTAAIDALTDAGENEGWIGLYSDDVETKWQFRSGDECLSDSHYKCVDFWLTNPNGHAFRPRCIGPSEQGYGCAVFYADRNGVDNNIDPENIQLPFLCDSP